MIIPWSQIDHVQFESIALDFVRARYPHHKWTPLPLTRDGNRDAETLTVVDLLDRPLQIQAWMEAKYTRRPNGLIPGAHLDSTLVSALIEPSVHAVVFVTNGRFDGNYIVRAQRALRIARHTQDPSFFDGRALEMWLARNPDAMRKYFAGASDPSTARPLPVEIDSATIVRALDYREGHFEPLRQLIVNEEYVLQLVLSCDAPTIATLRIQGAGLRGSAKAPARINLQAGLHPAEIPIVATRPVGSSELLISVSTGTDEIRRKIPYRVDRSAIEIRAAGQLRALQALFECSARYRTAPRSTGVRISGPSAAGKTWTLLRFIKDLPADECVQRFQFAENAVDNARRLCGAMLFITCGPAAEFGANARVRYTRTNDIDAIFLNELVAAVSDSTRAVHTIQAILRGDFTGSLVSPLDRGGTKILVLDDIHKLNGDARDVASRLFRELSNSENNTLLVIGTRPNLSSDLENAVSEVVQVELSISRPSLADIEEGVESVVGPEFAKMLAPVIAGENSDGMLGLQRALYALSDNFGGYQQQGNQDVSRALDIVRSLGARELVRRRRTASESLVADFVFAIEGGVEYPFIEQERLGNSAEKLIDQGLLVREPGSPPRLAPRHDLVRELYLAERLRYAPKLGMLLDRYVAAYRERQADVLGVLCQTGSGFLERYRDAALSLLNSLIADTAFGEAKALAGDLAKLADEAGPFRASLSDREYLALQYAHAECVNHTESVVASQILFKKVIEDAQSLSPSVDTVAFALMAEAEIFNCRFWQLDYSGFLASIEQLLSRIERYPGNLRNHEKIRTARDIAVNRKMMTEAALDQDEDADATFQSGLALAKEMPLGPARANLLMDRGRCLLKNSPHDSVQFYRSALREYETLGGQTRRLILCANQGAFASVVAGDSSADSLVLGTAKLAEARYLQEYATGLLELAAANLVSGSITYAKALIRRVRSRPSATQNPRRRMLVFHLLAVAASLENELEAANAFNAQALAISSALGASYGETLEHNKASPSRKRAAWAHVHDRDALWVETRIW